MKWSQNVISKFQGKKYSHLNKKLKRWDKWQTLYNEESWAGRVEKLFIVMPCKHQTIGQKGPRNSPEVSKKKMASKCGGARS